jgi:hypothetical protein
MKALVVNELGRGFYFEDMDVADTMCYVVTRLRPTEQEV